MHPHGVRYNPEYDGAYLGDFTRAGGFVAPGEEFTYTWECDAGLGRRLALPRPRPQPHAQHVPRAVRRDRSSAPKGAQVARRRARRSSCTSCRRRSPASTRNFQCINGRAYAGNTPTLPRARSARTSSSTSFGMDSNFHTFHIHGHRWQDSGGRVRRQPDVRAQRDDHRPLRRGQPRPLALPLPRLLPSGRGDGGLVPRRPVARRRSAMRPVIRSLPLAAVGAAARRPPRRRVDYPPPTSPARSQPKPEGPAQDATRSASSKQVQASRTIQKAVDKAAGRRHDQGQATAPTTRA